MTRAAIAALALSACTGRGDALAARDGLAVTAGFAFAPPTSNEAAAYVTVVNRGSAADTLLDVSSPSAAGAMLHRQQATGGMMRMEHVGTLPIAPGDSIVMAPGGLHLMLTTLDAVPEPGDSLRLVLRFARAGTVAVTVPVRAYGDEAPR